MPGDIESSAAVSLFVNMNFDPSSTWYHSHPINDDSHLKFCIFVADMLDPVLHGVDVLPLPLPAVLRRQLVPDLPPDLLQIPLLLSEQSFIFSCLY